MARCHKCYEAVILGKSVCPFCGADNPGGSLSRAQLPLEMRNALNALANPGPDTHAHLPDGGPHCWLWLGYTELVYEFLNTFHVTLKLKTALEGVGECVGNMTWEPANSESWTREAVSSNREWADVRDEAEAALALFDRRMNPPD